jgi:hypothetical protein
VAEEASQIRLLRSVTPKQKQRVDDAVMALLEQGAIIQRQIGRYYVLVGWPERGKFDVHSNGCVERLVAKGLIREVDAPQGMRQWEKV